jgi:hypothetical protein
LAEFLSGTDEFASQGMKACVFEKPAAPDRREAKTLDHFGFGLSG